MSLLNHSNIAITMEYIEPDYDVMREVMNERAVSLSRRPKRIAKIERTPALESLETPTSALEATSPPASAEPYQTLVAALVNSGLLKELAEVAKIDKPAKPAEAGNPGMLEADHRHPLNRVHVSRSHHD